MQTAYGMGGHAESTVLVREPGPQRNTTITQGNPALEGPCCVHLAESPARCSDFGGRSPSTRVISSHHLLKSYTRRGDARVHQGQGRASWCLNGEEFTYQGRRHGVGPRELALWGPGRALLT